MKVALIAALVAIAAPVFAHEGHAAMHGQTTAESPLTEGVVKKVEQAAGKVTLSHGPLPNGMPAMTMAFRVKDPAWIGRMKENDRIRFAAEQVDGAMTLVRFEPTR
ncbi:MAG: hypothetical protein H6R10_1958 [Rhodocyclaceae bacterium]|nr:hypothetical protein [Rhodocyclaceae bacterium]